MEKKYNVAIYLNAITVCMGLVCSIMIISITGAKYLLLPVIEMVMYLLICFYAFVWYKKPHGNLLRYLMFVFALTLSARAYVSSTFNDNINAFFFAVCIALVAYMSGRLNKINQNRFVAVIVLLLLCHCSHAALMTVKEAIPDVPFGFVNRISSYAPAFLWMSLSSAYFTRFLQHKEAGLTDK